MPTIKRKTRGKAGRQWLKPRRRAQGRSRHRPDVKKGSSRAGKARRIKSPGPPAYVLIPLAEYQKLMSSGMLESALAKLADGNEPVHDADDVALELAADRVAAARKAAGLTQAQLGAKLGLPQSQISRIEKNPDRTTVRTLKRIAKALRVDISALVR